MGTQRSVPTPRRLSLRLDPARVDGAPIVKVRYDSEQNDRKSSGCAPRLRAAPRRLFPASPASYYTTLTKPFGKFD
ncbi:unnamed protein product [Danaus chrysippus]|uniref:(African queen) hypothetical protein n=1 Tax=Danaus chrysippus TaxID=151541 RepID=A0A8J2QDR5_9NEOP|nr:unnamed protein product [Danaus chrysippus]